MKEDGAAGPAVSGRAGHHVAKALLAVVSFMVAMVAAEITLRYIRPLDEKMPYEFRIPDRVYGWVLQKDATYLNRTDEVLHRVTYNSRGFRDVEHTLDKPDGCFRLVVLGDSFMEGYTVDLEASFHRRLQARAADSGWPIEVINLGVGGYGTLQEYLVLRDEGWLYEPDAVLLAFYASNDVRNDSLQLESIMKGGRMKAQSRPFLDPEAPDEWRIMQTDFEGAVRRYDEARRRRDGILGRAADHFAVARLFAGAGVTPADNDTLQQARKEFDRRDTELAEFGVYYCTEPPEITKAWETAATVFARMKREADEHGVPLIVFSVPADFEVVPAVAEARAAEAIEPERLCFEEAPPNRRLKQILDTLDIDFIDLLDSFRNAARNDGISLFGRPDPHWNGRGHDLAAAIVLKYLLAKPTSDQSAN